MQTIRFERDNAVGRIILANPPFNRLDLRFSECLRQAVHDASESDVRVVLIKAEGPHFSFGGEVREWPGKDINWFRTFVAEVNLSRRKYLGDRLDAERLRLLGPNALAVDPARLFHGAHQ